MRISDWSSDVCSSDLCAIRAQRDHRLAIKRCGLARLCIGVAHVRDLVETDAPAIAQWKTEARQILRGLDRADRAHGLFEPAEIAAAAGCFLLHVSELPRNFTGGDNKGLHLSRIKVDADQNRK